MFSNYSIKLAKAQIQKLWDDPVHQEKRLFAPVAACSLHNQTALVSKWNQVKFNQKRVTVSKKIKETKKKDITSFKKKTQQIVL